MGKHTADDGADAHPLVAEALAVRPVDRGRRHASGTGTPVGWQGTPEGEHLPDGGGLGWPGDLPGRQADGADDPAERGDGAQLPSAATPGT